MGRRCSEDLSTCAPSGSGGTGTAQGGASGAGATFAFGGLSSNALGVHVENPQGLTIETITLSCAGGCADVLAVAHGGHEPYTFAWEDGTTTPQRHLCLDTSTTLSVSVTDTASTSKELHYDAQTASATVAASVLECPAIPDGGADGGAPERGVFCVDNPSFEGTPEVVSGLASGFDATPWNSCEFQNPDYPDSTPDIIGQSTVNAFGSPSTPTDGKTYLQMGWDPTGPLHEYVSQKTCSPLRANVSYSFTIDAAVAGNTGPGQLAVYASAKECSREQRLWVSPVLPSSWTQLCITLTPSRDADYVTLEPTSPNLGPLAFVLVDHLVPVDHCP